MILLSKIMIRWNNTLRLPLLAVIAISHASEVRGVPLGETLPSKNTAPMAPCLTAKQCRRKFDTLKSTNTISGYYYVSEYATKGCFLKRKNVYFGVGGTFAAMSKRDLPGIQKRIWCDADEIDQEIAPAKAEDELLLIDLTDQLAASNPVVDIPVKRPTSKPMVSKSPEQPTASPVTYEPAESPSKQPIASTVIHHPVTQAPTEDELMLHYLTDRPVALQQVIDFPTRTSKPIASKSPEQPTATPVIYEPMESPSKQPIYFPTKRPTKIFIGSKSPKQPTASPVTYGTPILGQGNSEEESFDKSLLPNLNSHEVDDTSTSVAATVAATAAALTNATKPSPTTTRVTPWRGCQSGVPCGAITPSTPQETKSEPNKTSKSHTGASSGYGSNSTSSGFANSGSAGSGPSTVGSVGSSSVGSAGSSSNSAGSDSGTTGSTSSASTGSGSAVFGGYGDSIGPGGSGSGGSGSGGSGSGGSDGSDGSGSNGSGSDGSGTADFGTGFGGSGFGGSGSDSSGPDGSGSGSAGSGSLSSSAGSGLSKETGEEVDRGIVYLGDLATTAVPTSKITEEQYTPIVYLEDIAEYADPTLNSQEATLEEAVEFNADLIVASQETGEDVIGDETAVHGHEPSASPTKSPPLSPSSKNSPLSNETNYLVNHDRYTETIPTHRGEVEESSSIILIVAVIIIAALAAIAALWVALASIASLWATRQKDCCKEAVSNDVVYTERNDNSFITVDGIEVSLAENATVPGSPNMVVVSDMSSSQEKELQQQREDEQQYSSISRTVTTDTESTPIMSNVNQWLMRSFTSETDTTPVISNVSRVPARATSSTLMNETIQECDEENTPEIGGTPAQPQEYFGFFKDGIAKFSK